MNEVKIVKSEISKNGKSVCVKYTDGSLAVFTVGKSPYLRSHQYYDPSKEEVNLDDNFNLLYRRDLVYNTEESREYDDLGRLIKKVTKQSFGTVDTAIEYNEHGRIETIISEDKNNESSIITKTYDEGDRLILMLRDGELIVENQFDERGNLIYHKQCCGEAKAEYDNRGILTYFEMKPLNGYEREILEEFDLIFNDYE